MKLAVRAILEIWKWKLSSGFYFRFPAVAVLVDNDQPVVGRKDENQDDQDKDEDNHNEEEYDDAKDKDGCGGWESFSGARLEGIFDGFHWQETEARTRVLKYFLLVENKQKVS